ncbi:MAG TPA: transposase [bacterium]|nr:transposase [bacterium]HPN41973.1 transposase [bacterium]
MKKRKIYDGTFKAAVVKQLILGKSSLTELAAMYDVHPNQIKNWKSQLLKKADIVLSDQRKRRSGNPY